MPWCQLEHCDTGCRELSHVVICGRRHFLLQSISSSMRHALVSAPKKLFFSQMQRFHLVRYNSCLPLLKLKVKVFLYNSKGALSLHIRNL